MKNTLKIGLFGWALASLVACEKEETQAVLQADAKVEVSATAQNTVLTEDKASENALAISWEMQQAAVALAPTYVIDFKHADQVVSLSAEKSPFSLSVKRLNSILADLKLTPEQPADIQIQVVAKLSDFSQIASQPQTLNLTPYADIPDLSTEWGVAGTLNNWGDTPDIPFWKVLGNDNQYVAYVTMPENGLIKFRKNQGWTENFGDNGNDKTLEASGADISLPKGEYRILWNVADNTYTVENFTWGIIGEGAKGWGDNDDIPLTFNGKENRWEAKGVTLNGKTIKFRKNHLWAENFGDSDNDGVLEKGGKDIQVPTGTFDIIVDDFSKENPKYKIIAV